MFTIYNLLDLFSLSTRSEGAYHLSSNSYFLNQPKGNYEVLSYITFRSSSSANLYPQRSSTKRSSSEYFQLGLSIKSLRSIVCRSPTMSKVKGRSLSSLMKSLSLRRMLSTSVSTDSKDGSLDGEHPNEQQSEMLYETEQQPKDPDENKSIHTGNMLEIHDVPMSVIQRPIPPVLDETKVYSLMESMKVCVIIFCDLTF